VIGVFQAIDGSDIGMIQRREKFGFALEASHAVGILHERFGKDLQCHVAVEFDVPSTIDLTHAASPNGRQDFIGAETFA